MPRKIHKASAGDTLENISRLYFGVPNRTQDIINSNPFLAFRSTSMDVDLNGMPLIFEGDVIIVITDQDLNPRVLSGKGSEELTLYLNGENVPFPAGSEVTVFFDACCNTFASVFPFDPFNNFDRKQWRPISLPEYEIYIGNQQITGGKFESVNVIGTPKKKSVKVSGRTFTLIIEKSNFPDTAYPLERENERLDQIVEWATAVFGLNSENQSEATSRFKKASCENETLVWDYLAPLATKSQRVLHASANGYGLEIVIPELSQPVARFEEGVDGFIAPQFTYNTADLFGNYLGVKESAKNPRNLKTFVDPFFEENSYKFFSLGDIDNGNVSDALKYEAIKSYRDYFTTSFGQAGFTAPNGDLWQPGQIVTLNAPSEMIYNDFDFLIRFVKYVIGPTKKSVELGIIPSNVYLGIPMLKLPFDF